MGPPNRLKKEILPFWPYFLENFAVLGKGGEKAFQFAANGNIVHDRHNGLMWEQSGSKPERNEQGYAERWRMNYQAALAYVAQLNEKKFGGYDNWRLPTVAEAL